MKIRELFENIPAPPKELLSSVDIKLDSNNRIVSVYKDFQAEHFHNLVRNGEFIHPIGEVEGDFNCFGMRLKSFKNFPVKVGQSLFAGSNDFSNFEGLTPEIGGMLDLGACDSIKSFSGLDRSLKSCEIITIPAGSLQAGLLSLLKIKNLEELAIDDSDEAPTDALLKAIRIVNKHLAFGRDILDCQDELIEAGLKEFARL